jgi:membrane protein implicated in regulation of membrane protease activity
MVWWLWLVLGLVLTALELMAAGGFYLIFFGLSALLIGTLELAGLSAELWQQWLLFTALALGLLLLFRNPMLRVLRPTDARVDNVVGEIAVPLADIPAGEVGRAELRGTSWSARNVHTGTITRGQRCRVTRIDGLMLFLAPE